MLIHDIIILLKASVIDFIEFQHFQSALSRQ
jgi:hypothetical protein